MQTHPFGRTGLQVSRLGFGTSQIGEPRVEDAQAERMLAAVLDAGANLIDTARSYGAAEERIGRWLGPHRDRVVLSTKVGYGVPGHADWTGPCVAAGIERALRVLQTGWIDIVHLHSCGLEVLQRGEVIEALERAKAAGQVRAIAYSGDNDELEWAIASGRFDSVQCSVNVCDQHALERAVPRAAADGLGVIGKRPLANAFWRFAERPSGNYCEEYWERSRAMGLTPGGLEWGAFALRFAAFQPGVQAIITGTASAAHWRDNVRWCEAGPLPPDEVERVRQLFRRHGRDWGGEI